MIAHVEAGRCKHAGQLNLGVISDAIRNWESAMGHAGAFTKKLLTNGQELHYSEFSNAQLQGFRTGHGYSCPLCTKMTGSVDQLRDHLRSRLHARMDYHCSTCRREFGTFSALIKHLELSKCKDSTQPLFSQIANQMKRLGTGI
ncbi:hypothetical protein HDU97_007522 [Phlyctochytrium planicorne]|nr:hypothetical protein HDU97_007522 [Phlyctochytrium planicorne]